MRDLGATRIAPLKSGSLCVKFQSILFLWMWVQVVAGEPAFPEVGMQENGTLNYGLALFHAGFLVVCNWIVWQARKVVQSFCIAKMSLPTILRLLLLDVCSS